MNKRQEQIGALTARGAACREITILYRAHYITRTLEEVFIKEKIPYVIYSGIQFFGRMEIKDALSYLRMAAYQDDLSFLRIANTPVSYTHLILSSAPRITSSGFFTLWIFCLISSSMKLPTHIFAITL